MVLFRFVFLSTRIVFGLMVYATFLRKTQTQHTDVLNIDSNTQIKKPLPLFPKDSSKTIRRRLFVPTTQTYHHAKGYIRI